MAKPLPYTPSPAPAFTAQDDLDRLVKTLHETGTLRLLNDLIGRFPDVSAVALDGLNTPGGRNALANILILLKGLGQIDADGMNRFMTGLTEGLKDAGRTLQEDDDPPGMIGLFGKLREPEVRRGLNAVLTVLGTLGTHLASADDKG